MLHRVLCCDETWILSTTKRQSNQWDIWRHWGRRKQDCHVDYVLQLVGHCRPWVLATEQEDQSASVNQSSVVYLAASLQLYLFTMLRSEPQENRRIETTSSIIWSCSCDYFLFPKLKWIIKETRFESVKANKRTVTTKPMIIPEESFQQS